MLAADATRMVVQALSAALLIAGGMSVALLARPLQVYGAAEAFFRPAATCCADRERSAVPEPVRAGACSRRRTPRPRADLQRGGHGGGARRSGRARGPRRAGGGLRLRRGHLRGHASALSSCCACAWPSPRPSHRPGRPFLHDLAAGFREVCARRWLWVTILVSSAWLFLVFAPFYVLGPVVADRDLGGAGAWATILAAYGLGGVAGGALALRWSPRRPLFTAALLFLLEAPAPALLALGAPVSRLIAASAALGGASFGVFSALWDTTMQRRVPAAALRGCRRSDWMGSLALLPARLRAGPAGRRRAGRRSGADLRRLRRRGPAAGHGRRPGHRRSRRPQSRRPLLGRAAAPGPPRTRAQRSDGSSTWVASLPSRSTAQ